MFTTAVTRAPRVSLKLAACFFFGFAAMTLRLALYSMQPSQSMNCDNKIFKNQ